MKRFAMPVVTLLWLSLTGAWCALLLQGISALIHAV